ncbi:MAG: carbohydate-binding domain-containing protein [Chitinophagaceae bacterium]|nr:carbohydate-binding domain-containing protein [Chitinophagaceae bacterium]MCW5925914.1 carbohydate-binding domain-containing protein [Chitinophagaceae bacterium]
MRKAYISYALFFVSVFLIVASCNRTEQNSSKQVPAAIGVRWELLSNFPDTGSSYTARFRIYNRENTELTSKNWALFFSTAANPVLDIKVDTIKYKNAKGRVEHINGDWYKLTLREGASLKKGDSTDGIYRSAGSVIKNTDAPLGMYVVFYDENGNTERISEITDYTMVPFTKKEQLLRGKSDKEVAASPAKTYWENDDLSVLDRSHLLPIIPTPKRYQKGQGTFTLPANAVIHYNDQAKNEAEMLVAYLKELTGKSFSLSVNDADIAIRLSVGPGKVKNAVPEGYELIIDEKGVSITGQDAAGVFYGVQSLLALLPTDIYLGKTTSLDLPHVVINDAPRFGFRSVHLDVSRNFQTKETVLRTLDVLARYKINHLLLYTSEDEGWRLEIPGLPELTEVGSRRRHVSSIKEAALHPSYGSGPYADVKDKYGSGYYSREDFIEILKYAAKRHIKIIPELNFPGHARAAIKSMEARYERLMKEGKEKEANEYRLVDPEDQSVYLSAQLYKDNVVNVSRESAFRFFEKVVDEIDKMYKEAGLEMDIFHAGGDEVAEGAWTQSPEALELLKQHPEIKDPKNLQAYFFRELVKRLEKRDLTIHGWEEVALIKDATGKYIPNPEFASKKVVPYIWNNLFDYPDLGYRLANAGYKIVLCNVSNFYFDLAYDNDPLEPGLYWAGFIDTKNAYAFAPYHMFNTTFINDMGADVFFDNPSAGLQALHPDARKNIIGIEAQLWSETIKGREMLEYYMLPKLLGFSESAWAPERRWEDESNRQKRKREIEEDWNFFANTIAQKEFPKLAKINGGYNYRIPPPGAIIENGLLKANVALPGLKIHYTTDGSEPTTQSAVYIDPIPANTTIKLKAFDAAGRSGRTIIQRPVAAGRLN